MDGAVSAAGHVETTGSNFLPAVDGPALPSDLESLLRETWCDASASFDETRRWLGKGSCVTTLRMNHASKSIDSAFEEAKPFLGESLAAQTKVHPILHDVLVVATRDRPDVRPEHPFLLVDALCGSAFLRGSDVFAPGVMAISESVSRKRAGQCSRANGSWKGLQTGDAVSILAYVGTGRMTRGTYLKNLKAQLPRGTAVFVGNGTLAMSPHEIFRDGRGVAVVNTDGFMERLDMQLLPSFLYAQTLPSAAVAHVLDPKPGEYVFDACAAPGGKTTHILSRMSWQGYVLAMDKSKKRAEKLAGVIASACQGASGDTCEVIAGDVVLGKWKCRHGSAKEMTGFFDRALCDAPCSASGLRPRLDWEGLGREEILDHAQYQRRVLAGVTRCVRPGGVVVYSTCSITAQENEENVRWALDHLPLRLVAPAGKLLDLVCPPAGYATSLLSEEDRRKLLRFSASGPDGMGFFISRFERLSDTVELRPSLEVDELQTQLILRRTSAR
eukprot:TRINITY_DN76008_c0_g1_i1.p1 TRINITY_DN76008_c0_g1~~TRINITY_DN76008_c0_g1_i1.p1  ORF type:complete len:515 (-),score=71.09 TRINITY_DN76008_c0_g1_i1:33-1532(-)